MTAFVLSAILLALVVAVWVIRPLWQGRLTTGVDIDRQAANIDILRDQSTELARERAEGLLSEEDYQQSVAEIKRRLLEETESTENQITQTSHSRPLAIALLVLIPLLALGWYGLAGNLRALNESERMAEPEMTPEKIAGMVDKLAARMKANPDDMQGWLMLARSYKAMGRYDEAGDAFAHAESEVLKSPDLLANYAETLAMANGKGFSGKPVQLIDKALKLDPKHPHSLFLAGAAAMEAGDPKKGITYWESLLPLVEPDSDIEKMLKDGIEQMRAKIKK